MKNQKYIYDLSENMMLYRRVIHSLNRIYFLEEDKIKLKFISSNKLYIKALPNYVIFIYWPRREKILSNKEISSIICHEAGHIINNHWGEIIQKDHSQYKMIDNEIEFALNIKNKYVVSVKYESSEPVALFKNKNQYIPPNEPVYAFWGGLNPQVFTIEYEYSADLFAVSCLKLLGIKYPKQVFENTILKFRTNANSDSIINRINNLEKHYDY